MKFLDIFFKFSNSFSVAKCSRNEWASEWVSHWKMIASEDLSDVTLMSEDIYDHDDPDDLDDSDGPDDPEDHDDRNDHEDPEDSDDPKDADES